MSATTRLTAFALAVTVALGAGAGLGATVGPDVEAVETEAPPPEGEGVISTLEGYRFVPASPDLDPDGGPFRFMIAEQDGDAVRDFTPVHERKLHLIVVNRELTAFHHVHPALGDDGTWEVELPPLAPGSYRAVADFQIADGPRLALGTDLAVAGRYRPTPLGEPRSRTTVDGYEVTLRTEQGEGGEVTATLTVRRDGELVTDLQPYLGAKGHLVAMRAGDLAYAHVHPLDEGEDGQEEVPGVVRFDASLPSAGRHGLFLDFKHDGAVHTASFTFDQGAVTGDADAEH